MAHHTLRVEGVADALRSTNARQLLAELRTWDVYPPFLYGVAGAVRSVGAAETRSWEYLSILLWVVLLFGLYVGFSAEEKSSAWIALTLLAANAVLLSLSRQRMLDFPAAAVALLALAFLVRLRERSSTPAIVLAFLSVVAALLSKHNTGLPLLPVGIALAAERFWRRDWRAALCLTALTLAALACWCGFLSWQDHGWESFKSFASNRANSGSMSSFARMSWYFEHWSAEGFGTVWAIVPCVVALLLALRRRSIFALAALLYALCSLLAIARHPYLLDRNFTSIAVMLVIPMAVGWRQLIRMLGRPRLQIVCGLLCATGLLLVAQQRSAQNYLRTMPVGLQRLGAASEQLEQWFQATDSAIVTGSFNELSTPWLRLLWSRAGHAKSRLQNELYYPLPRGRDGLDASKSPLYSEAWKRWAAEGLPSSAITLELRPTSPFRGGDYQAWNAWKQNYIALFEQSPQWLLLERVETDSAGLLLSRFTAHFLPVGFERGFQLPEAWGRWMQQPKAVLSLPALADSSRLVIELAPHHEQVRPIQLAIRQAGTEIARWEVSGENWRFQSFQLLFAPSAAAAQLELEILDAGRADASDMLLAFGQVGVVVLAEP